MSCPWLDHGQFVPKLTPYLEGQRDLVVRVITSITHIGTLVGPLLT